MKTICTLIVLIFAQQLSADDTSLYQLQENSLALDISVVSDKEVSTLPFNGESVSVGETAAANISLAREPVGPVEKEVIEASKKSTGSSEMEVALDLASKLVVRLNDVVALDKADLEKGLAAASILRSRAALRADLQVEEITLSEDLRDFTTFGSNAHKQLMSLDNGKELLNRMSDCLTKELDPASIAMTKNISQLRFLMLRDQEKLKRSPEDEDRVKAALQAIESSEKILPKQTTPSEDAEIAVSESKEVLPAEVPLKEKAAEEVKSSKKLLPPQTQVLNVLPGENLDFVNDLMNLQFKSMTSGRGMRTVRDENHKAIDTIFFNQ